MSTKTITFYLNGMQITTAVSSEQLLVDLLRNQLGLTGTKMGCGKGECGACTVLLDGNNVNSCLVLAAEVDGHQVMTIEGLSIDGRPNPIQTAFIEEGAVQCGFCTPGMIMSTEALLNSNPEPTEDEIKVAVSGNLCRCTGYTRIVKAVQVAAAIRKGG